VSTATDDSMLVVGTHGLELYLMSTNDDHSQQFGGRQLGSRSGLKLLYVHSTVGGDAEIQFTVKRPSRVEMKIYDVTGRLVYHRAANIEKPGPCCLVWDGRSQSGRRCASGVYFLRLSTKDAKAGRKFILLR